MVTICDLLVKKLTIENGRVVWYNYLECKRDSGCKTHTVCKCTTIAFKGVSDMIDVVGALIFKDGKLLICQRPKDKARGLLWEFVGGKVEKGESDEQALKRECREEIDVEIEVGDLFARVVHHYDDVDVNLAIYLATLKDGEIVRKLEHNDIKWIDVKDIDEFEFCPADVDVISKIKRQF